MKVNERLTNPNSIANRMLFLRRKAGIKQKDFAKQIGTTAPVVTLWEKGKREPSLKWLKKIAEFYSLPMGYFFEKQAQGAEPGTEQEFTSKAPAGELEFDKASMQNVLTLPMLDTIPIDSGDIGDIEIKGSIEVPRLMFNGAKYIYKSHDDAMAPKIEKGDFCIIRPFNFVKNNAIMLVEAEERYLIRRLIVIGDQIKLYTDNESIEPLPSKNCRPLGEIIGVIKKFSKDTF